MGRTHDGPRSSMPGGFSSVELLFVVAIFALLAGLAIAALFAQGDKARDAYAKDAVRTAHAAMEEYATEHGSYESATVTAGDLAEIEPALNDAGLQEPSPAAAPGDNAHNSYVMTVNSANSPNTFSITRHGGGAVEWTCTRDGEDRCPAGGRWDG